MPDEYADLIRGVVGRDPSERLKRIARQAQIPDDVADDYLKTTQIESGHNVNVRDSSKGAQGFGQVMPDVKGGTVRTVGSRKYNLRNPDENMEAGLRYFAEGGNDPVARRLYYFGGPRAKQHYERTGQIPNISDGNMTAAQYVKATGAQQGRAKQTAPDDDYSKLIRETVGQETQAPTEPQKQGSWASNLYNQKPKGWGTGRIGQGVKTAPVAAQIPRTRGMGGAQVAGESQPSEATQGRQLIRKVGGPLATVLTAGAVQPNMLPTDAGDYVSQGAADTAKGWMDRGAGLAKALPHDPFTGTKQATETIQTGARQLGQASQAVDKDTERYGVNVPVLGRVTTKDLQNAGSGMVASAPALVLQRMGVPGPLAFGFDQYLASTGQGKDFTEAMKDTGLAAAGGLLYEIPLPARMGFLRQLATKLTLGSAGGYGLAKAFGLPEAEARKFALQTGVMMGTGAKGRAEIKPELAEAVPASQPREFAPFLQPKELAQRIALREQGTVPAPTSPELVGPRITVGPRARSSNAPTPRGTETPVVPDSQLSARIGIQSDTSDILHANYKIDALNRRLREVAQIKQPTGRAQALQQSLEAQLAEATATRNRLLDPKVQAQLEGRSLASVLAERRQNAPQTEAQPNVTPQPEIAQPALQRGPAVAGRTQQGVPSELETSSVQPPPAISRGAGTPESVSAKGSRTLDQVTTEAPPGSPKTGMPPSQSAREVQTSAEAAQPAVATETTAPTTKPSRLAQGVEAKAVAAKLTEGFEGLPEYQTVNVKDQAQRATQLLDSDPELARKIAMGTEQPPNGLLPESVFTAVENRALQQGDVETIRDLATQSTRSVEASGMGQRIRMLAERNPHSAVNAISQIEKARAAPKAKVAKTQQQIKTEVQVEMKKAAPKIKDWSSFLETIKCQ